MVFNHRNQLTQATDLIAKQKIVLHSKVLDRKVLVHTKCSRADNTYLQEALEIHNDPKMQLHVSYRSFCAALQVHCILLEKERGRN